MKTSVIKHVSAFIILSSSKAVLYFILLFILLHAVLMLCAYWGSSVCLLQGKMSRLKVQFYLYPAQRTLRINWFNMMDSSI